MPRMWLLKATKMQKAWMVALLSDVGLYLVLLLGQVTYLLDVYFFISNNKMSI